MENILVSIVVPVYNAEKYLDYSVECLKKQSYTNIEILLVDDGSKDGSLELCHKFSREDSRIRVIHQNNGGPGKARNTGVASAKGEWIAFVDSDDKIGVDYIRDLVHGVKEDVELVVAKGFIRNSDVHVAFTKESNLKCSIGDCIYHIVHDVPGEYFNAWCGPWGKMFNVGVIKQYNLRFIENLGFLEDLVFCFEYFNHIQTAFISETDAYDYLIVEGSLTHKRHSYKDIQRATDAYLFQLNKLLARYPDNKYIDDFRCSLITLSIYYLVDNLIHEESLVSDEKIAILAYCKKISHYLHIGKLPIFKGNKTAIMKYLPLWVSRLLFKIKYGI